VFGKLDRWGKQRLVKDQAMAGEIDSSFVSVQLSVFQLVSQWFAFEQNKQIIVLFWPYHQLFD
jgi:hypothetical protein